MNLDTQLKGRHFNTPIFSCQRTKGLLPNAPSYRNKGVLSSALQPLRAPTGRPRYLTSALDPPTECRYLQHASPRNPYPYGDTSREQRTAGFERPAPGLLVPRDLGNRSSAGKDESPGALGLAAADLPRFAGTACRSARYLPAPRHAPVVRTLRRHHSGMLLSRLAVRYGGSLPAYPGLGGRLIAAGRQNRGHDVSLRRTRRLRLGLPA